MEKVHFKMCLLVCRGREGELFQPGGIAWQRDLPCGTRSRRKLCMVPCHSGHICGIWKKSKKVGRSFKVIIWARVSHYVILLFWNYIVSLTGYCKRLYRLPLFTILLLLFLFCIYWGLKLVASKCMHYQ